MPDLIRLTEDDRAHLKKAARLIEANDSDNPEAMYLVGRLDGLSGRSPVRLLPELVRSIERDAQA